MQELIYYLEKIYQMTSIPSRCFNKTGEITIFSKGYANGSDPVSSEPLKHRLMKLIDERKTPYIEIEDNMVAYALMNDIMDYIVILGPMTFSAMDARLAEGYAAKYSIDPKGFFIVKRSIQEIEAAISMLYTARYNILPAEDIFMPVKNDNSKQSISEHEYRAYVMDNTEQDINRLSYEKERAYLERIREGIVVDKTIPANYMINEAQVGKMAEKPLKQIEYMICTSIALATRAAMEGGLNTAIAYAISDLYLQQLEKCTNIRDMFALHIEMEASFAKQVNLMKQKRSKVSYVEKSKAYINHHLNKLFTMDELADELGIDKSHISRLFKDETGITVMQYARIQRIASAQNMLKYSNEPISTIAMYLCFPTQSHFGKVFKDITGTTPQAYRDKEQMIE